MVFHYSGRYSGDPDDLPRLEHEPGAVPFREPEDSKALGRVANGIAIAILIVLSALYFLRCGNLRWSGWGILLFLLSVIPHEYLHALCFKGDVYMYQNLRHGMLFVVSPERMSKGRFIFMSLLPNIVFGLIPYILFMIHPEWTALGTLGLLALSSGAGDYFNVFNAATQMPKGAWTYLHGFSSYWYIPERSGEG